MMTNRFSRTVGWIALTALAALAAGLGFVLFGAIGKGVEPWARWALVAVIAVALAAAWLSRPDRSTERGGQWGLRDPQFVGFAALALLTTFSVSVDLIAQFQPRNAVEDEPRQIQMTTQRTEGKVDKILGIVAEPPAAVTRKKYEGIWGRDNCTIRFKLKIDGDSLTLVGLKQPSGTAPYRLDATIVGETDVSISTKGENGKARGAAGRFQYEESGRFRRLHWWDDKAGEDPTVLEDCGPPAEEKAA
ncbi:MAG: hypothetical protein ABWX67_14335 [Allosphingosinicella sp.]